MLCPASSGAGAAPATPRERCSRAGGERPRHGGAQAGLRARARSAVPTLLAVGRRPLGVDVCPWKGRLRQRLEGRSQEAGGHGVCECGGERDEAHRAAERVSAEAGLASPWANGGARNTRGLSVLAGAFERSWGCVRRGDAAVHARHGQRGRHSGRRRTSTSPVPQDSQPRHVVRYPTSDGAITSDTIADHTCPCVAAHGFPTPGLGTSLADHHARHFRAATARARMRQAARGSGCTG